jgi:2-desacetyl-2-hydroxyethyl bacteriochlorophyllide A dehydrogenase
MRSRSVAFTAPRTVEVQTHPVSDPAPGEVRVRTTCSAISPGTELLVYRGEAPSGAQADATIDALEGGMDYPLTYGYACVGRVEAVGRDVDAAWHGRRVFAFHPHAEQFTADPEALITVPDGVSDASAAMIPNVETAVNLVMDGRPVIGESAVVFGQGVVGLLTTALLARHPLGALLTVDLVPARRRQSKRLGADATFGADEAPLQRLLERLGATDPEARPAGEPDPAAYAGADLVYELTGAPAALNDAVRTAGFDARIVVGSWYGTKRAPLDLGSRYHRSRIDLRASQVSTVAPHLSGRWTKQRRMQTVLDLLSDLQPDRLVTHRIPLADAPSAYALLDERSDDVLQPVLTYD